jgi:hypothetical protein
MKAMIFALAALSLSSVLVTASLNEDLKISSTIIPKIRANCPNQCNGKGYCSAQDGGQCQCFPGYHGFDCSERLCPSGIAWYDNPSADNIAHADYTECSNMVYTHFYCVRDLIAFLSGYL